MNSILLTNSGINYFTGGGIVSLNLLQSLQEVSDLEFIISDTEFENDKYENITAKSLNFMYYKYRMTSPFFMDYMAYNLIPDKSFDLAVTYACPFGLAVEKLKRKGCFVVSDLAPHNIEISRGEHMKFIGSYPYPHLNDDFLWGLYSKHLRLADVVVVHSHKSASYIMQKANLKEMPRVIPHGCYIPDEIAAYPEVFTPGYFGSIGIDKGITYMVNAWLGIATKLKGMHHLLLGGVGTEGFKVQDNYMHYFEKTGKVDNLSEFYNQISVYIQPSICDGFGITPLEAMAFGKPVIVSEGAGVSELIEGTNAGFVTKLRDVADIQSKISYFIENPDEITRMGREARELAKQYEWKIIKQKYIDIYKEHF